jgi:hypothetical protein
MTIHLKRSTKSRCDICLVAILTICASLTACGKTHASPRINSRTLIAAVRTYTRAPATAEPPTPPPVQPTQGERTYELRIRSLFASADYDQLEQEARDARSSKDRLTGGVWRLYDFYEALSYPPDWPHITEDDWVAHMEAVKHWIALHPDSATAQIVLASSYVNYGWFARGDGYSDSVSEANWKLFKDRIELAKASLLEAARQKDKCPYWFEVMQLIALADGWDRALAKELLEKAVIFEPTYYHFYREYANYLQTKWYGDDGDIQDFDNRLPGSLSADDSDMTYFEVASVAACQCQTEKLPLVGFSWPRIQEGYLVMRRNFGMSNNKLNRYALMAYSSDDKTAANQVFSEIGEYWDARVWKNRQTFETARAWAATP